jgi:hypothetical protein
MTQTFEYDDQKDEFVIIDSELDGTFIVKPLSEHGFVKEFTAFAIAIRQIQSLDYNKQTQNLTYKITINYKINENGKHIYLKPEKRAFDIPNRKNPRLGLIGLYVKNMEDSTCFECPMPNSYFSPEDFPYLVVSKINSEILTTKEQINEVIKSGHCLGLFDNEMKNRLS